MSLVWVGPQVAIVDDPHEVAVCITCEKVWWDCDMKFHADEIEVCKAAGHHVEDYRE